MTRSITIVLADEYRLMSAGLAALLEQHDDLRVVSISARGDDAVDECLRHRPALAVLDIFLPGLDGISAAAAVRRACPQTQVLLLAPTGRAVQLHRALSAGALGCLRKDADVAAIIAAIRRVAAGEQVLDPSVVAEALSRRGAALSLTASEARTLSMVATGMSNKEIAHRLALSHGTVRNYVSSLIAKTNARNRVDAIRIARELAWI